MGLASAPVLMLTSTFGDFCCTQLYFLADEPGVDMIQKPYIHKVSQQSFQGRDKTDDPSRHTAFLRRINNGSYLR